MKNVAALLFFPLLCVQGAAIAGPSNHAGQCVGPVTAKSGPGFSSIIELYTSEGCDSCPPADKWFSTLNYQQDGVVPLTFHVDYWDYIGWKDRFARPAYSQRQRETVIRQGSRTTYTPQVMLDGRDLRGWSNQPEFLSRLRDVSARTARANVSMDARIAGNTVETELQASIALAQDRADAALFIAITENNLSSRVTAGENRGVLLRHDHVVRDLIGPVATDFHESAGGKATVKRIFKLAPDWKQDDLSIIAFVQNLRTGAVLQSLSLPLCRR